MRSKKTSGGLSNLGNLYEKPSVKVFSFEYADVLTTSPCFGPHSTPCEQVNTITPCEQVGTITPCEGVDTITPCEGDLPL